MQITCPRCGRSFRLAPGATPCCPGCGPLDPAEGTAAPPSPAEPTLSPGHIVGAYRIVALLGQGGMSTVYKAEPTSRGHPVALKIPHREMVTVAHALARFEREARTLARLRHPHIVQVIDTGRDGDLYYIAMEYVGGATLGERIERQGRLPPAEGARLLRECCSALACAHRAKIVHRDVKPDNILLTADGRVKMSDFGLAKGLESDGTLSGTGAILGTPLYMSPEQADVKPLDGRSDIYSLGATFYHAFTGRPPFEGKTPLSIALQHVESTAPPACARNPSVPEGISRILERMMARRLAERFQSAEETAAVVESWEQGKAVPPPPPPAGPGTRGP